MEPEFDLVHAASPTVTHLLAAVVTDPLFESTTASALVVELVDFAATCRLDYAASLVADSESVCPSSIGRRPGCTKHPTVRSYAEAITASYSSQRQTAMDAEMASWKSTGTSVDTVLPPRANIVDGMWIFRVKRPPGSPPVFKARYIARGFSQRHGVDFFQTFSPTPKMTTLWAPREWHDTLRTTLAALGFAPSNADPSLFLRTDTSLPPFYILVYVDDLVFATADTEAQTLLKSELQKRHTCTDLDELRSYLGLHITRDRARRTITLTQLHMVLQRFDFRFSSPQSTPLPTGHSLSAPPLDESVELTGLYPEQVGCLMHLMTCIRPDLAYPLSILARYIAPGRHRPEHWEAAKRVLRYLCSTSSMGLVLGGRARVVLSGHADASWVEDLATQRSSQGYTFSLGSGSVSWRSTRSSSVLSSSCEAEIYVGAMAVQELRWLTYLLTDLGEPPRSPPILYEDNKAMLALCQEHRQEHMTKHIALRYFLARELQQRGQLGLAYVATRANTADIFTKALQSGCDHCIACSHICNSTCELAFWPFACAQSLWVWGCMVQYRPTSATTGKFTHRARLGVHLGFSHEYQGWLILDIDNKQIVPARDILFYERLTLEQWIKDECHNVARAYANNGRSFATPEDESPAAALDHDPADEHPSVRPRPRDDDDDDDNDDTPAPGPSRRHTKPSTSATTHTTTDTTNVSGLQLLGLHTSVITLTRAVEPKNPRHALTGPHAKEWRAAMDVELKALESRDTWHYGIDFDQTFVPVSRHTSVRILLAIAAVKHLPLRQINDKNAFSYTLVDATIFVEQPHTYGEGDPRGCQLKKSLYGIKQAPRLWQQHLHKILLETGFRQLPHDPGMYHLHFNDDYILLTVYVDDLLYTDTCNNLLNQFEENLAQCVDITINHNVT
ncbi:unnamed protein product [Closterium sp. NIES-54]